MKQKQNVLFWESNFREEVENRKIDDGVLLWAFSGACFALRTSQTMIYLDPYFGGDPVEGTSNVYRTTQIPLNPAKIRLADAAFITHEHYDHCHEETLEPLVKGTDVQLYGPVSSVKEMLSYDLPKERVHQVKAGNRIKIKDTMITVGPGYDVNEPQAVTYMLESEGIKVFFGGDSSAGPAFDEIGAAGDLDIALLAFGRTWYMNEAQMLDAAERLHPKLLLPFHWELWRGHTGDPLELGRLVERRKLPFEVRLLLIGDYLHYRPDGTFTKGM